MQYVLLGLGNPKKYKGTRHNIGKDFIKAIVKDKKGTWQKIDNYNISTILLGPHLVTCVVTESSMNTTGKDIKNLLNEINLDRLVVLHDDVDMEVGKIKLTRNKSSGGNKGIDSIIEQIGTKDFFRIKIGIGKQKPLNDFVIAPFTKEELEKITNTLNKILPCTLNHLFRDEKDLALTVCNTKAEESAHSTT